MNEQTKQKNSSEVSPLLTPVFMGLLLFVLLLFSVNETIKPLTFWVSILTLVAGVLTYQDWISKLTFPFVPLISLVFLSGLSTFYALAKKFALYEFLGVLLAFCVFALLLMFLPKVKDIAGALVVAMSCISFLSIDMISTQYFYNMLVSTIQGVTSQYNELMPVEVGVRMLSLMVNPNVFAGCSGIAVLLALGLSLWAKEKKETRFYLACLMVNSLAFVLAFSLGATVTIVLAYIVFYILEEKEKRIPLFIIMVETFVLAMGVAFPIFFTSFEAWTEVNYVPLICLFLAMVLLVLVHENIGSKAIVFFADKEKESRIFFCSVIAVLLVYGLLAVTITTPMTLEEKETVVRAIYPEAGEYTLEIDHEEAVTVRITSQNEEQAMMHSSSSLYRGDVTTAVFTVPEDSLVVHFYFTAASGAEITSASLSNGDKIPLHYPLLPGFVATRLQGLFANQNAIQRTVFFEDGMKLFSRSPLFGLGMGSFENALFTVQSFYYETKYVHNHYIQTLLELGMLGCVAYVSLLGALLYGLNKARKQEHSTPMLAMSFALVIFVFSHAFVEVVWSNAYYLLLVYGVFAIIATQLEDCCVHPKNPLKQKELQVFSAVTMAVFTVLLATNMQSRKLVENSDESKFMENLVLGSQIDVFETQDFMTTYINVAISSTDPKVHEQSEIFIEKLEKIDSNSVPYYIALYYFSQGNVSEATEALENYVCYVITKRDSWNAAFAMMFNHLTQENFTEMVDSMEHLYGILQQWNEDNMGNITLDTTLREELEKLGVGKEET